MIKKWFQSQYNFISALNRLVYKYSFDAVELWTYCEITESTYKDMIYIVKSLKLQLSKANIMKILKIPKAQ